MGMTQKPADQEPNHQKPKSIRFVPVIAGLLFVILAALVFVISENQARQSNTGFPSFDQSEFTLIDQDGVTRTNSDFAGKPIALFLGFTYCPDVCPTTLLALAGAVDDLVEQGIDASVIQTIFIALYLLVMPSNPVLIERCGVTKNMTTRFIELCFMMIKTSAVITTLK